MLDASEIQNSLKSFQIIDLGSHKVAKIFDGNFRQELVHSSENKRVYNYTNSIVLNEHSLRTRIRNLREQGIDATLEEMALLEMMK